jgi:hypothetical protein
VVPCSKMQPERGRNTRAKCGRGRSFSQGRTIRSSSEEMGYGERSAGQDMREGACCA